MLKQKNYVKNIVFVIAAIVQSAILSSCAKADIHPSFEEDTAKLDVPVLLSEPIPEAEVHDYTRFEKQREAYLNALDAYSAGKYAEVESILVNDLSDYPLAVNIEYLMLKRPGADMNQIRKFINSGQHDVLSARLKSYYIQKFDNNADYKGVLSVSPSIPQSEDLKCLWLKAQYKTGNRHNAVAFLKNKFTHAEPLNAGCMGLASVLVATGAMTEADIYSRVYEAYWTRNKQGIYQTAARMLHKSKAYSEPLKLMSKYYANPAGYAAIPVTQKTAATAVFRRYGRVEPRGALKDFQSFISKYHPSEKDIRDIKKAIIISLLFERDDLPMDFIDSELPSLGNEDMFKQRIRLAIWNRDYIALNKYLNRLPAETLKEDNYRYWRAVALENLGREEEARAIMKELAGVRSFYGYLAADKVGAPYVINEVAVPSVNIRQRAGFIEKYPAYLRFTEYEFLGDRKGLRTEWKELMNQATVDDARYIAKTEAERGYYDLALWESIYKKDWDVLSLRFPVTYREIYSTQSDAQKVSLTFMYGITRQESMMNPKAKSPVGAMGLMQIMPETAKIVSRKHGVGYSKPVDLLKPEVNVVLGTAYLKDLLSDFGGNRIFTSAGYNAGPRRAVRWQSSDGVCRDLATYVENIPFNETRNYVQKVVLYDYMYQHLLGVQNPVFIYDSEKENCY